MSKYVFAWKYKNNQILNTRLLLRIVFDSVCRIHENSNITKI